jgi:hypothetical protein
MTTEQKIVRGLEKLALHLERGGSLQEWKDHIELGKELMKKEFVKKFREQLEEEFGTWEEWFEHASNRFYTYSELFGPFECEICYNEDLFRKKKRKHCLMTTGSRNPVLCFETNSDWQSVTTALRN